MNHAESCDFPSWIRSATFCLRASAAYFPFRIFRAARHWPRRAIVEKATRWDSFRSRWRSPGPRGNVSRRFRVVGSVLERPRRVVARWFSIFAVVEDAKRWREGGEQVTGELDAPSWILTFCDGRRVCFVFSIVLLLIKVRGSCAIILFYLQELFNQFKKNYETFVENNFTVFQNIAMNCNTCNCPFFESISQNRRRIFIWKNCVFKRRIR